MDCLTETTICLLQAGTLDRSAFEEAQQHLASCSACLDLLRRSVSALPADPNATLGATLPAGSPVGRYIVLNLIGRGGMGDVYAAYDPELDRKIALKLLRADREHQVAEPSAARMLREAQAIARLSHPNVVAVYDVGIREGQVFIAMEFVAGQTAADWARETPRRWQEILRVYLSAGRGLAAAHDAGVVHRDFKPQNVMVHEDGTVRIMDFGLARYVTATATVGPVIPTDRWPRDRHSNVEGSDAHLTPTGSLLGTPAYMAPEQRMRGLVAAGSDQYSFCVSLCEALFGKRPPVPKGLTALNGDDSILALPRSAKAVPRRVRLAIERGLAPDPANRWPSMSDLLLRLQPSPWRRRRVLAASAIAITLMAAMAGNTIANRSRDICGGAVRRLEGIWELPLGNLRPLRRTAIRETFSRVGYADAFGRLATVLDNYAAAWVAQSTEACEATNIRNEQSNEALDLRMSCLGQRLGDMRALSDLLAAGEPTILEGAVHAAGRLPILDSCADVGLLRDIVRPTLDSKGQLAYERQRTGMAQARAMVEARRYSDARERLRSLTTEAQSLNNGALLAEALALEGETLGKLFAYSDAAFAYRRAFHEAMKSHHDEIATEAAVQLIALGAATGDPDADTWPGIARDLLDRIGGHQRLRGWMFSNQAFAADRHGRRDQAVQFVEQAIAIKRTLPDKQDLAGALATLSEYQTALGRVDQALTSAEAAMRLASESGANRDPERFVILNAWGDALNNVGRFDEARAAFSDMLSGWRVSNSPDTTVTIYPLRGIARSFLGQGRTAEALTPARKAVDICDQHPNVDPPVCADARFTLARFAEGLRGRRARR